jgi:hypothetical protein
MPDVLMGQRVKELVRRYFMEGNKSSNKAYYADLGGNVASPTAKATKRNKAQDTAEYVLGQVREQFSGRSQDGRALWLLKELGADVRAGNCYEMSILAAHMVLRTNTSHNRAYTSVRLEPLVTTFSASCPTPISPSGPLPHFTDSRESNPTI